MWPWVTYPKTLRTGHPMAFPGGQPAPQWAPTTPTGRGRPEKAEVASPRTQLGGGGSWSKPCLANGAGVRLSSHPMRGRSVRYALSGVALASLCVALTAIFAWGIIGKHRLDDDARLVFKATRAVFSQSKIGFSEPLPTAETVLPPPVDTGHAPPLSSTPRPRAQTAPASPSRSPPAVC